MSILRFQTNLSQIVRLKALEGKQVESQFGGFQHLFYTVDGDTFYVSDKVGAILTEQFRKLGVKPGDPVEIVKAEVGKGPERRTQWVVSVAVPRDELAAQGAPVAAGVLVVEKLPEPPSELEKQLKESIKLIEAKKRVAAAEPAKAPAWADFLVEQTNNLIDAYAQVLKHSSRHEGLVKTDDVRSIFLSAFINVTKGGKSNAA